MDIRTPHNNVEALRAAIQGHAMEHGAYPHFVALSSDVARAIFEEVRKEPNKYGGLVKIGGDNQPMKIMDIEMAQVQGAGRVELVSDLAIVKAMRSIR